MNIKEAIKIIKDEKLQGYNMNEERYNRENEVVRMISGLFMQQMKELVRLQIHKIFILMRKKH